MVFTPYILTIRNFMSFGNNESEIRLDFDNPTLIIGRNLDSAVDGQIDSNGSGKTTILNAINYVLYGSIISDRTINADDLINNINKKDMCVSIVFSTDESTFYKVERYRKNKSKGGNGVRIFKRVTGKWDDIFDDSHDITPDSISNADLEISSIVGMAFEVFSRIVAFSATHKPFLFLPASEQTEIIEEICGLSELSEKAENLKKQSKADKQELERLIEINTTIRTQRNQIISQIQSAKDKEAAWDEEHKVSVTSAKLELEAILEKGIDYSEQSELLEFVQNVDSKIAEFEANRRILVSDKNKLEQEIKKYNEWNANHTIEVDNANTKLKSIEPIDIDSVLKAFDELRDLETKYKEFTANKKQFKTNIADDEKLLAEKETELKHLNDATCPYCSQEFKASKSKKDSISQEIESIKSRINESNIELDTLELDMVCIKSGIDALRDSLEFNDANEALAYSSRYDALKATVERLQTATNPYDIDETAYLKEIEDIQTDITKIDEIIKKRKSKKENAMDSLLFDSTAQITREMSRISVLEESIVKLAAAINPLSSTVKELESIQLEDTKDAEITELEDTIEHQQFLVKLLTKKDSFVRKLLLQKSLPFLNTRLRFYLDKIGFLHKVSFQEDLTVKISQFGNTIGFGNLSSGQKARVNLALSFSFRDMLQARHGKLKFCILDECLDVGLGNVGVQLAAKMIKSVATEDKLSMFVISHRDEIQNMFDSKLIVELERGFSNVISE